MFVWPPGHTELDSGVVRISKRFPRLALTHWSKERSLESESKVRPPVSICHIDHLMDGLSKDEQVSSPTWSLTTKVFARVRNISCGFVFCLIYTAAAAEALNVGCADCLERKGQVNG